MDRILRRPVLVETIGVSPATLARWVKEGLFPAPIQLGRNSVGWRASEVQKWIETREPVDGRAKATRTKQQRHEGDQGGTPGRAAE
jgi:prophage regulatory protein